jgi:protein-tyrosine-phosphatase
MAEGFARRYGSDVIEAESAGFSPAVVIQPLTKKVMEAKNINIDNQTPKSLDAVDVSSFDLIINMSGTKLPARMPIEVRDWKIQDPISRPEEVYIKVRDEIENQVMRLILELRRELRKKAEPPGRPSKLAGVGRRLK